MNSEQGKVLLNQHNVQFEEVQRLKSTFFGIFSRTAPKGFSVERKKTQNKSNFRLILVLPNARNLPKKSQPVFLKVELVLNFYGFPALT